MERTFAIIKPDAVAAGQSGEIIAIIQKAGFRIAGMKMKRLSVLEAEAFYGEAMALGDELGMRPLVAHCHRDLGKLYGSDGKGQEAREHLTTAATMYRAMDMRFWLEQTEAAARGL